MHQFAPEVWLLVVDCTSDARRAGIRESLSSLMLF